MLNIVKNGQQLSLDASGNLNINLAAGSISGGNLAASLTGAAAPLNADYQGVNIAGTLTGVTGLSLGTSRAPTIAIVDGAGNQITSFGGGTQFADNAASGGTPTGTLAMGWDSSSSKVRALKVDGSQNLSITVATALPAGTAVIGHVIIDSASSVDVSDRAARLLGHIVIDTGANVIGSLIANQSINLNQVGGAGIVLGQTVMASSIPVVIASNQSNIAITDLAEGTINLTAPITGILDSGSDDAGLLRSLRVDASTGRLKVYQPSLEDVLQMHLQETRAIRAAIVALVCQGGQAMPEDFKSTGFGFTDAGLFESALP